MNLGCYSKSDMHIVFVILGTLSWLPGSRLPDYWVVVVYLVETLHGGVMQRLKDKHGYFVVAPTG